MNSQADDQIDPSLELCLTSAQALYDSAKAIEDLAVLARTSKPAVSQAQSLLKSLKERIKESSHIENTAREREKHSKEEQEFHRMVARAGDQITVAWNSDPSKRDFHDQVYAFRTDIGIYLHQKKTQET